MGKINYSSSHGGTVPMELNALERAMSVGLVLPYVLKNPASTICPIPRVIQLSTLIAETQSYIQADDIGCINFINVKYLA